MVKMSQMGMQNDSHEKKWSMYFEHNSIKYSVLVNHNHKDADLMQYGR